MRVRTMQGLFRRAAVIGGLLAACLSSAAFASCSAAAAPAAAASSAASPAPAPAKATAKPRTIVRAPVEKWRLVESESGPVNYYSLQRDADRAFIRGAYQPPHKKAVFGFEMPDSGRDRVRRLDWSWRAIQLPLQADECNPKKGDSPAVLYVTWKRMLKWYSLKYVWSASRPPGTVCDRRRNPFVAQDTIVLRSGGPLGVWQSESLDLASEFRKHFEDGDPKADIPSLIGIAVMT
ncbi:MAG TPA: DUF3047 domain-containing protein, partial [Polyangiaceae bacterium]|nr:DUF3047 domain-containing protein [Polyangiaceae bacterium]